MSSPFTSPANATWQTLLTEITLAYSERRQAISQSAYTPAAGKDVQAAAYWTALQAWLETNCVSYINHVSGPLNPADTAFLYFTLATWRAAAGLNAGFRRSTDGGATYSYGQMQVGNQIGPWIFEDLQKGFSVLRKTVKAGSFSGTVKGAGLNGGDSGGHQEDFAWMKSYVDAAYEASTPSATSTLATHARINHFDAGGGYVGYDVAKSRVHGNIAVAGLPALAHSWKAYVIVAGVVWEPNYSSTHITMFNTFGDFPYSPTDGVYSIVQSGAESSGMSHAFSVGGTTSPAWPGDPGASTSVYKGYATNAISFFLEWNFTNQNP